MRVSARGGATLLGAGSGPGTVPLLHEARAFRFMGTPSVALTGYGAVECRFAPTRRTFDRETGGEKKVCGGGRKEWSRASLRQYLDRRTSTPSSLIFILWVRTYCSGTLPAFHTHRGGPGEASQPFSRDAPYCLLEIGWGTGWHPTP